MPKKIDLTGLKFNRLTVVSESSKNKFSQIVWLCICDCGKETFVATADLKAGSIKSCGCLQIEGILKISTRHGFAKRGNKTPIYKAWAAIIQRCYNPNCKSYPDYGGRGIEICDRWRYSFENFLSDVGEKPSTKHSLDRFPDNDGDYGPDNFRWAIRKEQSRNTRQNVWIEHDGFKRTITEWAKIFGIDGSGLRRVLKNRSMDYCVRKYIKPGFISHSFGYII